MKPHPLLTTGVLLSSMWAVVGLMMCMGIPPGMDEMGDWPSLAATIVPGMNEWPDTEPTLGGHSCYGNHTQMDEGANGNKMCTHIYNTCPCEGSVCVRVRVRVCVCVCVTWTCM